MSTPSKYILISLFLWIASVFIVNAQTIPAPKISEYSLDGDIVQIEIDETGGRHLVADGNVRFSFKQGEDTWNLTAQHVDYRDSKNGEFYASQEANASGDVILNGPEIVMIVPGELHIDLFAGRLVSESPGTKMTFPDGEITTDYLEINRRIDEDNSETLQLDTSIRTSLTYNLGSAIESVDTGDLRTSLFSSLTFDFSQVQVETDEVHLTVKDEDPIFLDCPDPSVITSSGNTLNLPSFEMTFDPPILTSYKGVELLIGEENRVTSAGIVIEYPEEGGMRVELAGNRQLPVFAPELVDRVLVANPMGTFSADKITIELGVDGSQKIEAIGGALFEIPMEGLMQDSEPTY